jgi:hypothetical protein
MVQSPCKNTDGTNLKLINMKKKTVKTLSVLDKLKKKASETYKKSKDKNVLIITLTDKHLKKTRSTTKGVGYQNLKPTYQALYSHLMVKYKDKFSIIPKSLSPIELEVYVKK